MDVAAYRGFSKPGWVIRTNHSRVYIKSLSDAVKFTCNLELAEAFSDLSEAQRLRTTINKLQDLGVDESFVVIPIPDLPKSDRSGEIKKGLERVVGDIVEYQTVSLNYLGIASNLYDLISRIVEEKTKPS